MRFETTHSFEAVMTWSFSGPDGRATWEWTTHEVEGKPVPVVRWRRIGGHSIFKDP